jgi:ubiquinone/menaquinone biosynthesis C-methylase UbiE
VTGPVVRHGSRGPITAALALAATMAWSCATPADHVASGVRFPKPDRPVAAIVSPEYSDEQTRDRHQEAERVMDRLGIRPGMRVADVGAGLGYYTVRLARRLGPSATIYAQDVSAEYLTQLGVRLRRDNVGGVTLVQGTQGDPRLPPASIDVAILSHMYHEVVNPFEFLYRLHSSLAAGARVAIIDLDKRTPDHGTPPALLRCELAAVGYRQVDFTVLAPADGYLAVFAPPAVLPPVESIKPCKQ